MHNASQFFFDEMVTSMKTKVSLLLTLLYINLISLHGEDIIVNELNPNNLPSNPFSGKCVALTDYRSRGVSNTFCLPSIQGELKYQHSSGIYAKIFASNIDSRIYNRANLECDVSLGYQQSLFQKNITLDGGGIFYYYPGGSALVKSDTSYNTVECYATFNYKNLKIKLSTTATDFFGTNSSNPPKNWNTRKLVRPNGHSYGSTYIEFNYETPIYQKWRIVLHGGRQTITHYSMLNYFDWQLGIIKAFQWCEFSLSYIQASGKRAYYALPNNCEHVKKRTNIAGATAVAAIAKFF